MEKRLNMEKKVDVRKESGMESEMSNHYLTEEQLQDLIAGAEKDMYQAPDYLEQIILRKAEPQFMKESVEIVPIRHTIMEGKPVLPDKTSRQRAFKAYSIKIVAAAAAILILLVALPNPGNFAPRQNVTTSVENRDTAVKNINKKTTDLCSAILEKTNQLLQKEEQ